MVKYIHYKESLLDSSAMISDNRDERSKGYSIYIEFECDDFEPVLNSIRNHLSSLKPFEMDKDGVCNYSANTLNGHLLSVLSSDREINMIPYKMKTHLNGKVLVCSRVIE